MAGSLCFVPISIVEFVVGDEIARSTKRTSALLGYDEGIVT